MVSPALRDASSHRVIRRVIFLLFLLSGISGLVYEVVWTRMLMVVFGNTVFAVATVLSAFMTGLALGSFSSGRMIDRRKDPLRIYAALQVAIAVSAVLLTALLANIGSVSVWFQRAVSGSAFLLTLLRYAVSFGVLVVPTILMGATLPVLSKFVVEHTSSLGRRVGTLYALNTLGAAAGCYAAGFLLIGRIGLNRTVWAAAGLNLCVGVVAWCLRRPVIERVPSRPSSPGPQTDLAAEPGRGGRSLQVLVLCAMALSGFAALGYEVVWTKALILSVGNSVYAFAAMLTTFLVGLAIGGLFCSCVVDRGKRLVAALGLVEVGIGLYGIVCVHLFARMLRYGGLGVAAVPGGWSAAAGMGFLRAFSIMLFPTLLMGASFPLAARIYTVNFRRVGRGVGDVYSCNTVGAIAGSAVTGFVLVPMLGLQNSMAALGLLNVTVGLILGAAEPSMRHRAKVVFVGVVSGALLLVLWTAPRDVFRRALEKATKFIYYKEGISGTVCVEDSGTSRRLILDGREMAGTSLRRFDSQKILGHLPMLLHPNPRTAFVLGFGAGGTCYSISTHPGVERIDTAELCPAIVEAAPLFGELNHGILRDPKLHLVVNDGRNFLLTTRRRYDVISVDLLLPNAAGTGALYTKEFYELCYRRLNEGGLIVEWLPPHYFSMQHVKIILKTCQSVFPHTALWHSPQYTCLLMIGSKKPFRIDFQRLRERMNSPAVHGDLVKAQMADPCTLMSYFVAADKTLEAFAAEAVALNTDDLPLIEYSVPRARNEDEEIRRALLGLQQPKAPFLTNLGESEEESDQVRARLDASLRSMQYVQRAVIASRTKDFEAVTIAHCLKALELNPDNNVARRYLADAHRQLGILLGQQKGRLDEAIAHVSKWLQLEPGNAEAHGRLAGLLRRKNQPEAAIRHYKEAVRLNPDYAKAHFALGITLVTVGKRREAIHHVRTALQIRPDLPGAADLLRRLQAAPRP